MSRRGPTTVSLSPARWKYIKALRPSNPRRVPYTGTCLRTGARARKLAQAERRDARRRFLRETKPLGRHLGFWHRLDRVEVALSATLQN